MQLNQTEHVLENLLVTKPKCYDRADYMAGAIRCLHVTGTINREEETAFFLRYAKPEALDRMLADLRES